MAAPFHYRPQTELREGNVFTGVCESFCSQACFYLWYQTLSGGRGMSRGWVGMSRRGYVWKGGYVQVGWVYPWGGFNQRFGTHPRDMGPQEEGGEYPTQTGTPRDTVGKWVVRIPLEWCLVVHELCQRQQIHVTWRFLFFVSCNVRILQCRYV